MAYFQEMSNSMYKKEYDTLHDLVTQLNYSEYLPTNGTSLTCCTNRI